MSNALCWVVSYAVNATWEIPLVACAGWAAARLARSSGPRTEHIVWVATFLLGIVTPAVPGWHALMGASAFNARGGVAIQLLLTGSGTGIAEASTSLLTMRVGLIWLMFALYVSTVIYFAARLLWLLACTRAMISTCTAARLNADASAALKAARRAFSISHAVVLSSENVRGVVTTGARRPVILLSAGFEEQYTGEELLSALGHELAHIARHDYAKNLLYETAGLLVAFHPVMWMVKARMVKTREMTCDALVIERLLDATTYRRSLLRLAERMIANAAVNPHTVGIFDGKTLEERIMVMKREKLVRSNFVRFGLVGCITLMFMAAVCGGMSFAREVSAQSARNDGQQGTVYHPGHDVTNPVLTFAPDPQFPKSAQVPASAHKICVVSLVVDARGMPQSVHVVRSAGKEFDASALRAVQQYRFKPAVRFGTPVAVEIHIEVNFRKY